MDRITEYRQIVQEYLTEFATISPTYQLIFDTTHDGYSAIVGSIDYRTISIAQLKLLLVLQNPPTRVSTYSPRRRTLYHQQRFQPLTIPKFGRSLSLYIKVAIDSRK